MGYSSSGTSNYSEDLQQLMEQRKRKRMISNRESARRSRLRKQKHLDDLMAQVAHLRRENQQILATYNVTCQRYAGVESDNDILRAQLGELTHRLNSLNDIIARLSHVEDEPAACGMIGDPWICYGQPSIVAAPAEAGFMY